MAKSLKFTSFANLSSGGMFAFHTRSLQMLVEQLLTYLRIGSGFWNSTAMVIRRCMTSSKSKALGKLDRDTRFQPVRSHNNKAIVSLNFCKQKIHIIVAPICLSLSSILFLLFSR